MSDICEHGKHKEKPWNQAPDDYLKWMIEVNHSQAQIAKKELARREAGQIEAVLSPLAIDRASLYLNAACSALTTEMKAFIAGCCEWRELHRARIAGTNAASIS